MDNATSPVTNPHTQSEIAKFNALAKEFWAKDGSFKTLHQINPIRIAFIESFMALSGKTVVDIGCGGGILSEKLDELGAQVTGIDLSDQVINAAKQHQTESGSKVDYRCISTEAFIKENPPQADLVCCLEMLEHVDHPEQIVHDCAQLLKPGGIAVFSTINRTRKAQLLAIGVAEYILGMVPKGTHDYDYFIKPSELLSMAESAQLNPLKISGISYRPLQKDFVASRDTDINYLFAFRKAATDTPTHANNHAAI